MRPHLSALQTPTVFAKQQKKVRVDVQGERASQPSRTPDQCSPLLPSYLFFIQRGTAVQDCRTATRTGQSFVVGSGKRQGLRLDAEVEMPWFPPNKCM